jgi:hypothetical protein
VEPELKMCRSRYIHAILIAILGSLLLLSVPLPAQRGGNIGSEHVRLRMPADRETLGRDLAADLERCYLYMNRAAGPDLPRKILIVASWEQADNSCDWQNAVVTVGMNQSAAAADPRAYLLHNAAKEMARLGLLVLSGGARREDTEFLFEGMSEILAHEYDHTSRTLEGAWVISKYLDEMKLLGFATQRSWSKFSSGKICLRSAAPGISLLATYRELLGRDSPLKLFEALKKNSLLSSIALAFRSPTAEVESTWIQRVREYQVPEEIIINTEEGPRLLQTAVVPGSVKPGSTVEAQFYFKDRNNNLLPDGVFVLDERTGNVLQPTADSEKGVGYFTVKIPVEPGCPAGDHKFKVTAVDESGNVRHWPGTYKVIAAQ